MILGIDAHNLRSGGGITHLINLIVQEDFYQGFEKIYFFGGTRIIQDLQNIQPEQMTNLEVLHQPNLDKSLFSRIYWQQRVLPRILKLHHIDILFSPGGILPHKIPENVRTITMCHNMLPIHLKETRHLGIDLRYIRFLLLRILQLNTFKRADNLIFISKYARSEVEKLLPNLTNTRNTIYHGINANFYRKTLPEPIDPKKRIDLLYVSTIDVYKHQWEVVRALSQLHQRGYKNIHLKLIGSPYPPALKYLNRIIKENSLEDHIEWLGAVPYHEIHLEYHKASIFVFASSCENCPNILLEAMASGLPIACSNSQPMPEFTNEESVRYFDPMDPESIANQISYLIDNPTRAQTMGKNASIQAQKYRWDICAQKSLAAISGKSKSIPEKRLLEASIKTVWLIGPLPPPPIGQSIAFKMLCDDIHSLDIKYKISDIGGAALTRRDGSFSLLRVSNFFKPILWGSTLPFKKKRIIYLTIAQSWNGFLRDMVFILFSWLGKHRIILHLHGGNYDHFYDERSPFEKKLIKWVLGKATKIIILSDNLKSMFNFLPKHEKIISVVPNGLPFVEGSLPNISKSIPDSSDEPIQILYLSNLIESKGYLDVLEAASILTHKYKLNLKVNFCGNFLLGSDSFRFKTANEAKDDFFKLIKERDLENVISWHGSVYGSEKESFLRDSHFFILPTNYNNEGQPISIIEAMAYGCCVITTAYRAIPDLIGEEEAGIFVPFNKPSHIAERIVELTKEPLKYKILSQNAIKRYTRLFTKTKHLDNLKEAIFN